MEQAVLDFIHGKRIAVVGVSRNPSKFGTAAYKELKERGYQVFPVHPQAEQILGDSTYPNLAALQGRVDGVLVVVPPQSALAVIQDAAAAGIQNVWLQQGSESPEVVAKASELKLNLVSKKCILMYAEPVRSIHRFHRGFMKLIGQL